MRQSLFRRRFCVISSKNHESKIRDNTQAIENTMKSKEREMIEVSQSESSVARHPSHPSDTFVGESFAIECN